MLLEAWEIASFGIGLVTFVALWRASLHPWRVRAPGAYWNVPLRTLHAYVCCGAHFLTWGAFDTRLGIERYHAPDPEQIAGAWGMYLTAATVDALFVWPAVALGVGLFVFAARPRRTGRPARLSGG